MAQELCFSNSGSKFTNRQRPMFWVTENIRKHGMYVLGVIIVYETFVYVIYGKVCVYTGLQCKVFTLKRG